MYAIHSMCRPKPAWFLRRLGLKTGIDLVHFGLKSGMILEGTTGVYEHIYLSFQFRTSDFFCCCSNLSNH